MNYRLIFGDGLMHGKIIGNAASRNAKIANSNRKRRRYKIVELFDKDKVAELKQRRDEAWRAADAFYWSHVDDKLTLSEADARAYKPMLLELKKIDDQIYAEKQKPTTAPIRDAIGGNFDDELAAHGGTQMKSKNFVGISGEQYHREFIAAIRDGFKFAVTNNILREGAMTQGGYLVPTELDEKIFSVLEENNVMRQIARVITTQSSHRIPIVASKPTATWTAEGDALTFSDETFGEVTLDAYKISCGLKISRELLEDAYFDVQAHIIEQCGNALARSEEESFILGDGVGKPTGLLTSIDGIADAVITTTGAEITTDDLITLEYTLPRPYRKTAVWLTSDAAIAQIRKLKDSTGNFIWTPALAESENPRLLGYPIYTSAYMPPPRSGAISIIFGDMKLGYVIGDRGGRTLQALHETFAVEDCSAYILRQRVDGKLVDASAVKALRLK